MNVKISPNVIRWAMSACAVLIPALAAHGADTPPSSDASWPVPVIVPIPDSVSGVATNVVKLANWKSAPSTSAEFWRADVDTSSWPAGGGRGGRGGRGGASTQPAGKFSSALRTSVSIPADWAGKRVVVRFDGVGGGAKLWVNGVQIRDHWGSLTPWSADITDHVKPGADASITLGILNLPGGLGAFVRGGGIQRDAMLMAEPAAYLTRCHVETEFDPEYKSASLFVRLSMALSDSSAMVRVSLKDSQGGIVPIRRDRFELTPKSPDQVFSIPVANPKKWDAEHPNLYTLTATVLDSSGAAVETVSRPFGFRQVMEKGNQLFVNGKEVKLRGIWGMNSVAELKALNANHTRQKWVTDQFLADADRLGLYVLDETPVDFAKYGVEADPQFSYQWLSLISDLMERDWDHPSVIMWGLGNESFSGANILKMFKYAQSQDKQRPAMYSWANRVPVDQELPYSIYSSHYPDLNDPNANLGSYTVAKWHSNSLPRERTPAVVIPVLHDEYSHVVLNQALLDRDPNVRNFWGESIYNYWEKMFVTQGALGGDIFGFGGGFGGPGGQAIEHFLAKKAYSPIRIANQPLANPGNGKDLSIPIKNWFDHTNLRELTVHWAAASEGGEISGPDLEPHATGTLIIPGRDWKDGEELNLKFTSGEIVVDEFLLLINPPAPRLPVAQGPAPRLEETAEQFIITGDNFKVVFDRYKGLISNASVGGKTVLIDGPFLDLLGSGLAYGEWWCDKISAHVEGTEAIVDIKGNYAIIRASFQVRIDGKGLVTTKYTIDNVPGEPPPVTYSPWNATSIGGYSEVGVSYMLPRDISSLAWKRKGLWSIYPQDHIGRNQGSAKSGTDDFRATKESIYEAAVTMGNSGPTATALSDGRDSVRLSADPGYRVLPGGIRMGIHNLWNYPDIGLGNYAKPPILVKNGYGATVYLKLGAGQ